MRRVHLMLEQAQQLRRLADTFDDPAIRAQMLDLAERCERVAAGMTELINRPKTGAPTAVH
jgi:hypothetical protein